MPSGFPSGKQMSDQCPAYRQPFPQLIDMQQFKGIGCPQPLAQIFQRSDSLVGKKKSCTMITVVSPYPAGIFVHNLLHGFFRLSAGNRKTSAVQIFPVLPERTGFIFGAGICVLSAFCLFCLQILQNGFRRNLSFGQRACHIFLRSTAGGVSGRIESLQGGAPSGIYPESAGSVSACYIWFCPINFHILPGRSFSGLQPLQCLHGSHVQIRLKQLILCLPADSGRSKVAGTSALSALFYRSVDSLRSRQSIFFFVDFSGGVDLRGMNALRDGSCRRNGVLAPQSNKTVLQCCHFGSGPYPHGITPSRIERRIPHLVTGKTGIIRPVKSGSSAGGNQHSRCTYLISDLLAYRKTVSTAYPPVSGLLQIRDVDVVQNRYMFLPGNFLCQKRFDILSIDFYIPPSSGNIVSLLILQDNQSQSFQIFCDSIHTLSQR